MRTIAVSAAQLVGAPGAKPNRRIVDRLTHLLDEAASKGAGLVVYPELSLSGYFPSQPFPGVEGAREWFQDLPDALTQPLFWRADELGVDLVVPFAEWASGERFNAALVYRAGVGVAGTYRKVHTPESVQFSTGTQGGHETDWFSRGTGFPVFDLGDYRLGVQICYDRHLPESTRSLALNGAEIVAICSSSRYHGLVSRGEIWDLLCRTRAYENNVFIVAANKVGDEDGRDHMGRSCIVSPGGEILRQSSEYDHDGVVVAEVDLDEVSEVRRTRRFLKELRPEVYPFLREFTGRPD